jgi:hypothetical protein
MVLWLMLMPVRPQVEQSERFLWLKLLSLPLLLKKLLLLHLPPRVLPHPQPRHLLLLRLLL